MAEIGEALAFRDERDIILIIVADFAFVAGDFAVMARPACITRGEEPVCGGFALADAPVACFAFEVSVVEMKQV